MINIITENILNLNKNDQDQLFTMLVDNIDLLLNVVPNSPLLIYIKTGKPVDNSPIIQAYSAWNNNQ